MFQLIGHLARWTVRRLVRLYYPKIEISGADHIPREGAVLLAANHANSLIDPVIVGLTADRPVRFFAKAPLFDTPVLGRLMRALGMLPAFRGQDDGAQVRKNLESLNVGAQALAAGEAVGIFPEGKSHDSLKLEQIRSGAARMAVGAVEQGAKDLRLVPIGINYQRKTLFRSAIWVRVGRPINVARFVVQHGGERQAMRALTTEIQARLKRVVLHLDDPQLEPFLDELELLVPPPKRLHGHIAISAVRQRKRLADAMNFFRERETKAASGLPLPSTGRGNEGEGWCRPESSPAPDASTVPTPHPGPLPVEGRGRADTARSASGATMLADAIQEYRSHLAATGLNSRSPVMRHRSWRLFLTLLVEALWLGFWFPAAIIGALFHGVPFVITRALARKIQDGSTTTALSRLGLGLPIYALWYAGAWFAIRSYFLPWVAWTTVGLMPLAGIFALTYAHRSRDICRNWLHQIGLVLKPERLRALRAEQGRLREKLSGFVAEFSREFPSLDEQPRRYSRTERVRFVVRWAAIVMAAVGIFVWQNWRFNESGRGERMHGLNLAGLSTNSLAAALQSDEAALSNIVAGVNALETRTKAIMAEYANGKRDWYRQSDDDAVRAELLAYVNYRAALLRIVWKYQDYEKVPDEPLRLRAFLASYTAASVLYEASVKFVTLFADAPNAVRKLNEAEPLWSIPPGLFDTVRRSLADTENRRLMQRAQEFYRRHRADFARLNLQEATPFAQFHAAIAKSEKTVQQSTLVALAAGAATPFTDARDTGKEAIYRAQMFISSWVGDTKVREPHGGKSLIKPAHLQELRTKLQPGDLMLERRNWFLSNAFLPGYWPHAALYIGTEEDLRRLGLDRDPRVRKHWEKFLTRDDKGHERVILEAISEGVVFTSMEHSVGEADAAAFLRPNLSQERIKEVIARAFSHAGKPYDFEFDFFSTDKLVCSEVVYRAFDGDIKLPLVDVMGRKTLPPIEIVRQCARERNLPPEQFTFVAWLHSDERTGRVFFGTENDFYKTTEWSGLDLAPRR